MSGEVVLLADREGSLERLVGAIGELERQGLPARHALIGGLAVMARLARRHRPTGDIDAVYAEGEVDVVQLLVERGADRQREGVVLPEGLKLDLIAVGDFDPADVPDDARPRAFVLSHRWALDTADSVTLAVARSSGDVVLRVRAPVASAAALVATKLQSALWRSEIRRHKRAGDIYDLYRLLDAHDAGGDVAAALAVSPQDLGALARELARRLLVDEAERSARWLRADGGPEMQGIGAADLRAVGEPLVRRLATGR
ncbi:MAG: nucleotidyl transferase AbiEii/AbiGii toxin family protein [Acidobacteria bacterium]|nr:nucleotidyl transferase AbiEii/AbiGii toxin family protein [Acidobacteriota bacterium]